MRRSMRSQHLRARQRDSLRDKPRPSPQATSLRSRVSCGRLRGTRALQCPRNMPRRPRTLSTCRLPPSALLFRKAPSFRATCTLPPRQATKQRHGATRSLDLKPRRLCGTLLCSPQVLRLYFCLVPLPCHLRRRRRRASSAEMSPLAEMARKVLTRRRVQH